MEIRRTLSPALGLVALATAATAQFSDTCAGAGPIVLGINAFDATTATTDGLALDAMVCDMGPFGDEQIHNDVWATFTPATSENFNISTTGFAAYDTRLAIYGTAGCPDDPLDVIACNDDEVLAPPFEAGLTTFLSAGTTYKVRLGSYDAATIAPAPGFINISGLGAPVANDDCANAIAAVELPALNAFDTNNATTDGSPLDPMVCDMGPFGDEQIYAEVWFDFTPTVTKNYEITTFNLAGFDTRLAIYNPPSCPASPANVIACNDDQVGPPFEAGLQTVLNTGVTYKIRLGGFSAADIGAGNLSIGDPAIVPTPANDDCVNAVAIVPGFTPVDTTFATDGSGLPLDPLVCDVGPFGDEQIYQDVWFLFTPGTTQSWNISALNTGGFDGRLAVYNQSTCPDNPANVIACNDDGLGSLEPDINVNLNAGTTYLIRYGSYGPATFEAPGNLLIQPSPMVTPPANDDCLNATALPGAFGVNAFDGTNATTDGTNLVGFCDLGSFGDDQLYNDIWFTYTPTTGGCTYVSTLGLAGFDTRLAVYSSTSCPDDPATVIACADDEIIPAAAPFESGLDVDLTAGQTYLIRLGTYFPGTPNGIGSLAIDAGPQADVNNGGANPGAPGCAVGPVFASFCNGDGGDQLGCTDCPCGNNAPMGTVGGCLNSSGNASSLAASGDPSVSLPSGSTTDLRFTMSGGPPASTSVLLSGDAVAPTNVANPCFGLNSGAQAGDRDGLRCAVQSLQRHGNRQTNASGEIMDPSGPNRVWGGEAQPTAGIAGASGFAAGQTRYFQVTHREDPAAVCMRGLNTSQAVEVTFTP